MTSSAQKIRINTPIHHLSCILTCGLKKRSRNHIQNHPDHIRNHIQVTPKSCWWWKSLCFHPKVPDFLMPGGAREIQHLPGRMEVAQGIGWCQSSISWLTVKICLSIHHYLYIYVYIISIYIYKIYIYNISIYIYIYIYIYITSIFIYT